MAHCRSEAAPENIRWVSSQVAGDITAQTVTIRSIGLMPNILCFANSNITTNRYADAVTKFQIREKSRLLIPPVARN